MKLDVRSEPAKRTGAKPNTAYTLFAEPRAKPMAPDPRHGEGDAERRAHAQPARQEGAADAQFDYQNPEEGPIGDHRLRGAQQAASAKASLQFDTRKSGYRFVGGSGDPVDQVVCNIDKPFVLNGRMFGVEFSGGLSGTPLRAHAEHPGTGLESQGQLFHFVPNGEDKPGSMATNGDGTIHAGSQSRTTSGGEHFTLTPVADCE